MAKQKNRLVELEEKYGKAAVRWAVAFREAESMPELTTKDLAHMLQKGTKGYDDMSAEEISKDLFDEWEDEYDETVDSIEGICKDNA